MTYTNHLREQTCQALKVITEFVFAPQFQLVLTELRQLRPPDRPNFVRCVLLEPKQLAMRGVAVPSDLIIQRSVFADGRPTLFCVSKELHDVLPWHKVTITFDNEGSMIG